MDYSTTTTTTTTSNTGSSAFGMFIILGVLAVIVVLIMATWKLFQKAGKPGWASLIPIYRELVLLQIIGRPWWWFLLLFIPVVGLIVAIMICLDLAKAFGKDAAFAVLGLIFFPYIGYPILGFGSSKYVDLTAGAAPAPVPVAPTA
jgi:uncharacterized membrane protein YhaH (DUF805 family)